MIVITEPVDGNLEKSVTVTQGDKIMLFEDIFDAVRWYNILKESTNTWQQWNTLGVKFLIDTDEGAEYRP